MTASSCTDRAVALDTIHPA